MPQTCVLSGVRTRSRPRLVLILHPGPNYITLITLMIQTATLTLIGPDPTTGNPKVSHAVGL